jgi:hypothetical protein
MIVKSAYSRTNGEQQQSCDKKSSHYEPSNLESDSFLPKNNSRNKVSIFYNSYNTNSIRSDNNDIYCTAPFFTCWPPKKFNKCI